MSFLDDYAIYTSGNESPQIYHDWAGISCLSHLLGRRVWTDQNVFVAYPNLYVILTGVPGVKKSTAMRLAKRIVAEFKHIPMAGASITKEAMVQLMAQDSSPCLKVFKYDDKPVKYSQLSIFANEMINLLNSGGNPIGMIDFFTDVWDQPTYRDTTKNKGDYEIVGPYIPVLGCMTTDSLKALNSQKIISGGMIRRCIFVLADQGGTPVPFPQITEAQAAAFNRCISHARFIQENKVVGPFTWEHDARQLYEKYYLAWDRVKKSDKSMCTRYFYETIGELAIKLSMIYAISEDPEKKVHTQLNLARAIQMLTVIERNSERLFESAGRNDLSGVTEAVRIWIQQSNEPIMVKRLRADFWKDAKADEMDKILAALEDADIAVRYVLTKGTTRIEVVSTPEVKRQIELNIKAHEKQQAGQS